MAGVCCGFGTLAVVAEELGRQWIRTGLGQGHQKYEGQPFIGVNPNLLEEEQ